MRIHYPSSFLKLLLAGFAFAILPLLWAFINANIAFDKLAKQSEMTITNAVETTRAGRILQEQQQIMERSVRQYFVLHDHVLLNNYQQASVQFNTAILQLKQLTKIPSQQAKLEMLSQHAEFLNQAISSAKNTDENDIQNQTLSFLNGFDTLSQAIASIVATNNSGIANASSQLRLSAEKTQKNLFLQSLVLIPLTLLVAGTITFLLARPIGRMDNAIKNLGEGQYDAPIAIDGPGDLRKLGRRLDWLRTELKELNEQKQQFLRHVSHELKTPLTAIREATELLNDGIGGALSSQQAEITSILRDNSIRLQKMIENLLNYTKLESTQPVLNLQEIELPSLIKKVIKAHTLSIRSKQLAIETAFNGDEIVTADKEKLTIILDNLISNAVKYTPNSGTVTVSSSLSDDWVVIEVRDDGPGLTREEQDKLFDPFYRGDTVNISLIKGSGLGLTIAKDLVDAHGGSIHLMPSKTGAHFIVKLPKL